MSETTYNLIQAMANGDALETEQAFGAAMAEKLAVKLDDMRTGIAQNMFNAQEPVVEEDYELTDEEFNEILSEGELAKAVKAHAEAELYNDRFGGDAAEAAAKAAKDKMHSLAKARGIKPERAGKVSDRLINRAYGDDDGIKVKK